MKRTLFKKTLILFFILPYMSVLAQGKRKGFTIKGILHGSKNNDLVRLYDLDEQKLLDSAFLDEGRFVLNGVVNKPSTCWLQCGGKYITIMVENTAMTIEAPLDQLNYNHIVTGGIEQRLLNQLNKEAYADNKRFTTANDSLENNLFADTVDRKRLANAYNTAMARYMTIYVNFGKKHPDSYLGQDIIYRNRKKIARDTLVSLYKQMRPLLKGTQQGIGIKHFLYSTLVEKGKPMVDFEVKDTKGKAFKLSSLKGKYIYLTFGSRGCGPCRTENKTFAANFTQLPSDLALVSFSLDRDVAEMNAVIKEDGVKWTMVSDFKGDGDVKNLYNVQAMPTSFLINKEGVIIERYEGYSDDLLAQIKEKMKQ